MAFLMFIIVLGVVIYFYMEHAHGAHEREKKKTTDQVFARINEITEKHKKALAVKYRQTVYEDDYGNTIFDDWEREVDYFIKNVLLNDAKIYQYLVSSANESERIDRDHNIRVAISEMAIDERFRLTDEEDLIELRNGDLDGEEYEEYCAEILRNCGWDAKTTSTSGDQGIDIIANMNGKTVVFQCKYYSQPVGNSAVQEIIAGKAFSGADVAAVITNNSYTKSAKQLAAASEIKLLHHSQIEEFTIELFE